MAEAVTVDILLGGDPYCALRDSVAATAFSEVVAFAIGSIFVFLCGSGFFWWCS